jgi:hypothetical protein
VLLVLNSKVDVGVNLWVKLKKKRIIIKTISQKQKEVFPGGHPG